MIITDPTKQDEYYSALVRKDNTYKGIFYVGIKTTGIFCHSVCTAKKPKKENCEFFYHAQDALTAGYRPCKICKPLSLPGKESDVIRALIDAVENNPEKRWADADFADIHVHAATARRQFKKRFGMTFVAYARARRMGIAMKEIRAGKSIIDAQVAGSYESASGFRDAFSQIMGTPPNKARAIKTLWATWIDTPLGPMISIADENELYLLEFAERRGLEREVEHMRAKLNAAILPGRTDITSQIEQELSAYFTGKSATFSTPIHMMGTPFQQSVWRVLQTIPLGETRSYAQQASAIGKPSAVRAVANANGANQIAIVIPCHRVIGTDGSLTGYAGGLSRKEWLLKHEKEMAKFASNQLLTQDSK